MLLSLHCSKPKSGAQASVPHATVLRVDFSSVRTHEVCWIGKRTHLAASRDTCIRPRSLPPVPRIRVKLYTSRQLTSFLSLLHTVATCSAPRHVTRSALNSLTPSNRCERVCEAHPRSAAFALLPLSRHSGQQGPDSASRTGARVGALRGWVGSSGPGRGAFLHVQVLCLLRWLRDFAILRRGRPLAALGRAEAATHAGLYWAQQLGVGGGVQGEWRR